MRLVKIKPHYFRSFGDSDWINLDADLVVLFGPNGYGKTSLAEAIEWLLYGKTKRRERGEDLCQRDYQGSYRNAHAPKTSTTFVEAVFRLLDGTECTIRRELLVGPRNVESSRIFVNSSSDTFTTIGIVGDEIYNPIIAQDNLQDFIHSRPKDRRDKISAILGLDPLVRFKTVVNKARTRIQNVPHSDVVSAQNKFDEVIAAMRHFPLVQHIMQKWVSRQFNLNNDFMELRQAALNTLGLHNGDWSVITDELKQYRENVARRAFDDRCIQPPPNLSTLLQILNEKENSFRESIRLLEDAYSQFISAAVSQYSEAQLQFWISGLKLLNPERPNMCPMCEAETLTIEKRAELEHRITQSASYSKAAQYFRTCCREIAQEIKNIADAIKALYPSFLNVEQRSSLKALFADSQEVFIEFLKTHDIGQTLITELQGELKDLVQHVENLYEQAASADTVKLAGELIGSLQNNIKHIIKRASDYAVKYLDAHSQFDVYLKKRIANITEVREIDGLLMPILCRRDIVIIAEYNRLLDELLEMIRQIEEFIQKKQSQLFATRGQEIKDWYNIMNPGALVRYNRMEPATDNIVLLAETFGVEVNAVACLSQCQLNCLGLSIHFVRALTPGNPFSFLVLDDPVQSMDDDHCQSFVIDVIKGLLDRNLQVIIFSHVKSLIDDVCNTYFDRQLLRLRISHYQKSGPIIENAETLQQVIKRVENLAKGNEDHRRLALSELRRCVELLIRDVCRKTNSQSPPDDATANQMLPYFAKCPGVTPQQCQGIKQTINFSDPASHTEVGWSVPVISQISPHINRLREIARQMGVW